MEAVIMNGDATYNSDHEEESVRLEARELLDDNLYTNFLSDCFEKMKDLPEDDGENCYTQLLEKYGFKTLEADEKIPEPLAETPRSEILKNSDGSFFLKNELPMRIHEVKLTGGGKVDLPDKVEKIEGQLTFHYELTDYKATGEVVPKDPKAFSVKDFNNYDDETKAMIAFTLPPVWRAKLRRTNEAFDHRDNPLIESHDPDYVEDSSSESSGDDADDSDAMDDADGEVDMETEVKDLTAMVGGMAVGSSGDPNTEGQAVREVSVCPSTMALMNSAIEEGPLDEDPDYVPTEKDLEEAEEIGEAEESSSSSDEEGEDEKIDEA